MSPMLKFILLSLLVVVVVCMVFFRKKPIDDKLEKIRQMSDTPDYRQEPEEEKTQKREIKLPKIPEKVRTGILSAGIMLNVEEFILIWVSIAFIPALIVYMVIGSVLPAMLFVGIGAFAPILYINYKKKKRLELFGTQLGDALMLISNGLRAGFSFEQVLETVATELPDPISQEFGRVTRELKMGMSLENSLTAMTERMENTDLRLLTSAVLIQRQVGGNLADILDTIAVTIRDRIKIKNNIKTLTAQGRISGLIVGVMPIALFVILSVINPEYMGSFFTTTIGKVLIAVAILLELGGFMIIKKMINIEA